jgi:hypothetical protein
MDDKKAGVASWLTDLISKLGFPIVISGWLLYERATSIAQQSETLQKLSETINQNSEVVQQLITTLSSK